MRDWEIFFSNIRWFDVKRNQKEAIFNEINEIDPDRLLNTSIENLCIYLYEKFSIKVPEIKVSNISVSQKESDKGSTVNGITIIVRIPFDGEESALYIRPTSYTANPPSGYINNNEVIIEISGVNLQENELRMDINRRIENLKTYLKNLSSDVELFNNSIKVISKEKIKFRKERILKNRNLVAELGFKLEKASSGTKTFAAPEIRRKISSTLPKASTEPFNPEPVLTDDDYEYILNIIKNMALVMERSPKAFVTMKEEDLRQHFLVQLNGHFEGSATGETFNYDGKTDILIRISGKNIFIAECKFWEGEKSLLRAIDQILGYSSWRDTKVALIIFNRNKRFSSVLDIIPKVITKHPNYKRNFNNESETEFKCIFVNKDDPNRELILSVLVFNIPRL